MLKKCYSELSVADALSPNADIPISQGHLTGY